MRRRGTAPESVATCQVANALAAGNLTTAHLRFAAQTGSLSPFQGSRLVGCGQPRAAVAFGSLALGYPPLPSQGNNMELR